jgi:hypothetical protein
MTAVHPTAFKQQVAKEKKEKLAKQKSTRYATLAGGLTCFRHFAFKNFTVISKVHTT